MDYGDKIQRKTNPREQANIFNFISFGYTLPLFWRGLKKELEEDDLYQVTKTCRSHKCGDKLERHWKKERLKKNASIVRILWTIFGARYLVLFLMHLSWKLLRSVLEPESVGKLVSYFKTSTKNEVSLTFEDALYYAGVMIAIQVFQCFYFQHYVVFAIQLGIQIRTSFCSLIYRKSLRLTPSAMSDINLGNIITVLTKDVLIFESNIFLFIDMWIEVVRCVLVTYLIYNKMGVESLAGIGILLAIIPLQVFAGKMIENMRLTMNKLTDGRLQATQEILSAIKIIKMYTWEKIFYEKVDESRKKELSVMIKISFLKTVMVCIGIFTSEFGFYSMVMLYIYLNDVTSAEVMFYVMECFRNLKHAISIVIPLGFGKIAELMASTTRINRVLNAEELPEEVQSDVNEKAKINITNATVKVNEKTILQDVSWRVKDGLTIVTGPLACGKSSLLKLCLKDYPLSKGSVVSEGAMSYSSQDPWLFPSTIKQNILFCEEYNENRYREVIRDCALQYDFSLMDNGDETIVADRGINLSRGQQARINLARAVYKESDIYLLDDPLNALDSKIQESVFNNCIRGFLKGKIVVMVSHNKKHINTADYVVVMNEGHIKHQGIRQEIISEVLEEVEEDYPARENQDEENEVDEKSKLLKKKTSKRVYSEIKKEGSVEQSVYKRYLKFGGGVFMCMLLASLYILREVAESSGDKLLTMWVNTQDNIISMKNNLTEIGNDTSTEYISNITTKLKEVEDQASFRLNMYTAAFISLTTINLIRTYFFLNFVRKASVNIHRSMINTLTKTVMTFYDNYFVGNILNRFSQDLNVVDEQLPHIINNFVILLLNSVGLLSLIISVNWTFTVPCTIFILIMVSFRFVYIPTARSLKRLESASKYKEMKRRGGTEKLAYLELQLRKK